MYIQSSPASYLVILIFSIIYLILFAVIIFSWIPAFDMRKEPLASMQKFYNFITEPFRALIPNIGMFDVSPVLAFFALQFIERAILLLLARLGI